MISIKKPNAPEILVTKGREAAARLCEAYLQGTPFEFQDGIYAASQVKETLKSIQFSKCAYCESFYSHTGFGDVEHFRPKAGYKQAEKNKLRRPGYYWLAYDWDNLFATCQICNQQCKKNLFPLRSPRFRAKSHLHDLSKEVPLLIHPARDDIESFIGFRKEYAYAIGGRKEGTTTIEVFGLNRPALVENRRGHLEKLKTTVSYYELLRQRELNSPDPGRSEDLRKAKFALRTSQSDSAQYAHMGRAYLCNFALDL